MENGRRRLVLVLVSLIATLIAMRTVLYFYPNTDLIIKGFEVHHLFVGVVLLALSGPPLLALRNDSTWTDAAALAFGAGMSLALDELVLLIATDGSNAAYYLPVSYTGALISIALFSMYLVLLMRMAVPDRIKKRNEQ